MREPIYEFLRGKLSRRQFVSRLTQLGVAATAAPGVLAQVEPQKAPPPSRILASHTGGEVMAEFLREWKIPYVFGLGGSEEVGFLDALVDRPDLRYVTGLHENSVFSMADGFARASGQTAVLNLHSVAGTANSLGAMVNAFKDGTALVITVGRQARNTRGRAAFLEAANLHMLPREYARWTWDVLRGDTIPETLRRAFHFAEIPPSGPTFITFSKDLWEESVSRSEIIPRTRSAGGLKIRPDNASLKRLGEWLISAKFPIVIAGRQVARRGMGRKLAELSDRLGFGVASDLPDSHSPIGYPTSNQHYLGMFGRDPSLVRDCDLFLSLGGTMFTVFGASAIPRVPRSVRTAHVSATATEIGRTYPVDLPLIADVDSVIAGIGRMIQEGGLKPDMRKIQLRRKWAESYHHRRGAKLARELQQVSGRSPMHAAEVLSQLNDALPEDAWIVSELATSDEWLWSYFDFHRGPLGRNHMTSSGGYLGWGIGAALGAKLGRPGKPVVLFSGDGSFQFGVQSLWSAARYEIPVLMLIFNNSNYQANRRALVRYDRRSLAERKFVGCYLGHPDIDHVTIARGYGVEGARVDRPDRFKELLDHGMDRVRAGKPFVLDVPIARLYPGADSQWDGSFSVAELRRQGV